VPPAVLSAERQSCIAEAQGSSAEAPVPRRPPRR
jgi:hypothetical protein